MILAAESIAAASKRVEAAARTALATCMAETGCPAVTLDHHVVHLGTKPQSVSIDNESAIPAELMRTPQPVPDRVTIGKLLRLGRAVPGARLTGNKESICIFRSKSL